MVIDVGDLAQSIGTALHAEANADRAIRERAYLKSGLVHLGASVPAIRSVARATARRHRELTREQLTELLDVLWTQPVHEYRMVCVELLSAYGDRLEPSDMVLLERFLRESLTWALVDGLAGTVVGRLVQRHPKAADVLDRWAIDPDFWMRRSALLALLVPLREGGGDFERFARYADSMLDDPQFFIRKAIGWVLRDTARKRPELVFDWLLPRAARASAVTVREAVKPLSAAQRAAISAARHSGVQGVLSPMPTGATVSS